VPRNFLEIDRLLYFVLSVETDCHLVPQGAYKLTTKHEVHRNESFTGLKPIEAFSIQFYSHFRNCLQKDKQENLEMDDAIFEKNFLDDAFCDAPRGCWSVQKDSTKRVAVVRNLQYPGYFAFHKANSKVFGSFYCGEGLKNAELPFML